MNKETKPFKQAVKSYYENKNMPEDKLQLLSELLEQSDVQNIGKNAKGRYRFWSYSASAIAASLVIAMVFIGYQQPPELITAAYADVIKDSHLNNGLAATQMEWIAANHIAPAPEQYNVEMSKFCDLSGYKTTHLRIAGQHQGKLNIFFKKGPRPYRFGKTSGKMDNMHWKVLESKKDITVVVMYTEDMRENVVNKIVTNMLPDLTA